MFIRLLCVCAPFLMPSPSHAGPQEYEIKAAFIYQMARFVEWPQTDAPLRLCVLGQNPFGSSLEEIRGKKVGARSMEIALLELTDDARGCAVLFIPSSSEQNLDRILALTRAAGILTVGDTGGYAQRGVMVNFYLDNDKVRFEINLDAVRRSGLIISSKLLSLARVVDSRQAR